MIYQFLYARKREGYKQLNDWSNTNFSNEDIASMESLRKYTLANGIDSANLPECIYYYNVDCSIGRVGVIGKTSYVRAGSSKESGDRETSFVHKYIFSEHEYDKLLSNPKLLFDVNTFCETVEDVDTFKVETIDIKDIYTPSEEIKPEEMLNITRILGLSENDFVYFLYALIEAAYKLSKRVYLMLPTNDRNGSCLAKKFCEGVFTKLPKFVAANCGFITYTDTFHNTTTNNIPGTISLIFVAQNELNALKLNSIADESYIFDKKRTFTPKIKLDQYTEEMLENLKNRILYGNATNKYDIFFKAFSEKINFDCALSPEVISAAYQFYYFYNSLKERNIYIGEPAHIACVFRTFLQNPDLINEEIHNDVIDYTKRILSAKSGEFLLDFIANVYDTYEPIKNILIEKLCDQCKDAFSSQNSKEALLKIINHPSLNSEGLLPRVYDRLYSDSKYYDQASLLVSINLSSWLKSDNNSNEIKIRSIFESISELYNKYPGLVLHKTYISSIFDVFREIIYKNNPVNYDDVFTLYCNAKDFVSSHRNCNIYYRKVLDVANDIIGDLYIEKIDKNDMKMLKRWRNTILKEINTPSSQILNRKFEIFEISDYRSVLEVGKIHDIVGFLMDKSIEEIARIFPYVINEAMQRISGYYRCVEDLERHYYDKYNLIIFLAASCSGGSDRLCAKILKDEGMPAMKQLYDNIIKAIEINSNLDINVDDVKTLMRKAFADEFEIKLSDKQYREYMTVEKFVKETLGLYYTGSPEAIDNPAGQKKGLKNPFKRK